MARFALALGAVVLAANVAALRSFRSPYPPPARMRLAPEDAVLSASLLSLGMRRLAADIAFIRLLIYYGTQEARSGHDHDHGHEHPSHEDINRGVYAELKDRALRILALDPYFDYAVLYAAGALGFNLERPQEALDVLQEALRTQPHNWRLLAYVAAIGFQREGDPGRVLQELLPVVQGPEAPTMMKNVVAFMLARQGRREEAVRLYKEILASRDENYHHLARRALERLGAQ